MTQLHSNTPPTAHCEECGNPMVPVAYAEGFGWTGKCEYCGSIITATKDEVDFL